MHYEVKNGLEAAFLFSPETGEMAVSVISDNAAHTTTHVLTPATAREFAETLLRHAERAERTKRFRDSLGWEDGQTDKGLILGATMRFIENGLSAEGVEIPRPLSEVRVRASLGAEKSGANGGKGGAR